ncbi:MAG: hypothetical protein JW993_19175 [Sedimentisphaerales bacterium]|nr:hypothetical protein [Sedimentisphaerales bacterium]
MTAQTRLILKMVSYLGLAVSIVPAFLFFTGVLSKQTYFHLMIAGMVMWFGTAAFWVKRDHLGQ